MPLQDAVDDFVVIQLEERLEQINSKSFHQKLEQVKNKGKNKVILDFEKVRRIDCIAIGIILSFHRQLKEHGGGLIIININNKHVAELFSIIKMNQILPIKNSL